MKISELITALSALQQKLGDVGVSYDTSEDGFPCAYPVRSVREATSDAVEDTFVVLSDGLPYQPLDTNALNT